MSAGLDFWHWLILGGILLLLELLTGGGFLFWIGIAAAVIGVVLWLIPTISFPVQLILFALSALAACISWWVYLRKNPQQNDQPALNRRSEQYIGRILVLESAIENGRGRVKIGDSLWRVSGNDLPVGTRVKVLAVDGVILLVEKA